MYAKAFLVSLARAYRGKQLSVILHRNRTPPSVELPSDANIRFFCCGHSCRVLQILRFVRHLYGLLLRRPVIVLSNHVDLLKPCWFTCRAVGVPYGVIVYGIDAWNPKAAVRAILRGATAIASISRYTSERLADAVTKLPSTCLLPPPATEARMGCVLSEGELRERLRAEDGPVILTVCRLSKTERRKGYDTVLEAMPDILEKIPSATYVLVGEGDDVPRIRKRIEALGLRNHVRMPGYVPNEQLGSYYSIADVFVMPSSKEGFGIVFLEALMQGVPVIGGNVDGTRDALMNGQLGLMVTPGQPVEVTQAILNVIHGQLPDHLASPATVRERAVEAFGEQAFLANTARFLGLLGSMSGDLTACDVGGRS
ncbi:MAG: glycosyltransferase family 4 protein [Kiritimatiellia bacterium]|nr:glycosyltransferase family 4 protein [Kiritimatiellia bacterium]